MAEISYGNPIEMKVRSAAGRVREAVGKVLHKHFTLDGRTETQMGQYSNVVSKLSPRQLDSVMPILEERARADAKRSIVRDIAVGAAAVGVGAFLGLHPKGKEFLRLMKTKTGAIGEMAKRVGGKVGEMGKSTAGSVGKGVDFVAVGAYDAAGRVDRAGASAGAAVRQGGEKIRTVVNRILHPRRA